MAPVTESFGSDSAYTLIAKCETILAIYAMGENICSQLVVVKYTVHVSINID